MKGVVVTTDNRAFVKHFSRPLHESVGEVVGGYIETVYPRGLPNPLMMVVNEEGLLRQLPMNPAASHWYGTQHHGWPICGDAVVMALGYTENGSDIIGLTDAEVEWMLTTLTLMGVNIERSEPCEI